MQYDYGKGKPACVKAREKEVAPTQLPNNMNLSKNLAA